MEQIYLEIVQSRLPVVLPFSAVRDALKSRGRQNDNVMTLLIFDWPVAQQMVEALARHVSDALIDERGPVLFSIVEAALLDYQRFSLEWRRKGQPDAARLAAFASALIRNTAVLLSAELHAGAGYRWRVDGPLSFGQWFQQACKDPGEITVGTCFAEQDINRESLYRTLINPKTQSIFEELCYEQAVVSGRACAHR